ncbi:hypothetical protein Tco_1307092 [Tanacetum coccineum]
MADKEKKSTMKGVATNDQTDYYSRITIITVNGKNAYELKGKFLDDLHNNAFSGTNEEDAVEHIKYFLKIVDPIDLPNVNQDKLRVVVFPILLPMDIFTKGALWDYCKLGSDEIEPTSEEPSDIEETDRGDKQEIALKDRELKEEALRNKAIMEGIIDDDDESSYEGQKRWNIYDDTNRDQEYEMDHEVDERQELCSNETHELPVCNIRRFEMIKYSFGDDEEYVVIKKDEYVDLASTSKDASRAYQEIFRMMDEGWMVTRNE